MELLSIILVSISLSMDAFSLALAYGTLNLSKKIQNQVSITVGIFHFVMPIIGMSVKSILLYHFHISFDIVTSIIYIYLGIMLLLELKEEQKVTKLTSLQEILLFSLAVSLDSFSVGIALKNFTLLAPISFALFSFSFTKIGLVLGSSLHQILGKVAILIGGITFLILSIL